MDKLPNYVQVESPLEFTRLVCALERMPRVSFLHEHKWKKGSFCSDGFTKRKTCNLLHTSRKNWSLLMLWI